MPGGMEAAAARRWMNFYWNREFTLFCRQVSVLSSVPMTATSHLFGENVHRHRDRIKQAFPELADVFELIIYRDQAASRLPALTVNFH